MENTQRVFGGPSIPRNISLPAELSEALTRQARREDRPVSRVVQRALIAYLLAERAADDDRLAAADRRGGGSDDWH